MKPMDLSKFRKSITKTLPNISSGWRNPETWMHTGNYGLNYRISGSFFKGIPLDGKFTLVAGESGSGKSYLCVGNIGKWCQEHNIQVVLMDTENAVDKNWAEEFGIDVSEETGMMRFQVALIDDIATIIHSFVSDYKKQYEDVPYEEKPKILFIVDSLGMSITPVEQEQFEKGDMKGDLGKKQKQLFSLCRNFLASCGSEPIGMLCTQHTYASQDMFSPDPKVAGGGSMEFAPSIVIGLGKTKLKEDEKGVKTTDVKGIKCTAVARKTRYAQPFQKIQINIPWDGGMDPYSGLFELFSESLFYNDRNVLSKEGSYVAYYDYKTGEQLFKKYRKDISHDDYDKIMKDYEEYESSKKLSNITDTSSNENIEIE